MRSSGVRAVAARLAAAALAAGLAGCGSASHASPRSRPRASVHPSTATRTRTSTSATTTSVTATTAAATTTTALATTTTTDLPGAGRPPVLLGDMNTPEQFIIGELYADALRAQGYTVELNRNIGPTTVTEAAMSQGSLDIFPEYLNVYDSEVADDDAHFANLVQAFDAGQIYANAHGQTLLRPTPFSDTSGIAVLTSFAKAHHLRTMADLSQVQDLLTFGSPLEFSTEPGGLLTLEQAYHFTPAVTTVVTIGLQYRALVANEADAVYDQTTDYQLTEPIFTNLADSAHVLGYGNVVPVVESSVLAAEGPDFSATVNKVDSLLSTRAIRGLTAELEGSNQPAVAAAEVAKEFLQGYGLLPPPAWSTAVSVTTPTPSTTSEATTTTPLTVTAPSTVSTPPTRTGRRSTTRARRTAASTSRKRA